MGNIIIASEKLKLFEVVEAWADYAGYTVE